MTGCVWHAKPKKCHPPVLDLDSFKSHTQCIYKKFCFLPPFFGKKDAKNPFVRFFFLVLPLSCFFPFWKVEHNGGAEALLLRNNRLWLNEMWYQNPSEFAIFWDYVNPKNIFPISFGTTSYVDITTFHRAYIFYFWRVEGLFRNEIIV